MVIPLRIIVTRAFMLLILSKRFKNRYFGASGQSHTDVYNTEANHLQTSLVHRCD